MDKWLSHPTAIKIISIVIALLLWAVVHFDPESTPAAVTSNTDKKIIEAAQIIPTGLDETKYSLVQMEPTVVRIMVEGRRSKLLTAKDEDYIITADLSGLGTGEHVVPLTYTMPSGVTLLEISQRTVKVDIEEIQTRSFDLGLKTSGTPSSGYIVGTPSLVGKETAASVKVTLPKDEMEYVGSVSATVSVEGAKSTVEDKKASVVVYDTEGKVMEHAITNPKIVDVEVPVTPPIKMVPLQISYTGSLPEGLSIASIKPEIDKVAVYADQKTLDALDVYNGVTIDLGAVEQSGTVKAKVTKLDGIVLVEPAEINVEVNVVSWESLTLTRAIQLTNVGEGLFAEISKPQSGEASLNIHGAPDVLSAISDKDLQLTADLQGLKAGTHTIKLTTTVPRFVTVTNDEAAFSATVVIGEKSDPVTADPDASGGTTEPEPSPTPEPSATPDSEESTPSAGAGNDGSNEGTGATNAGGGEPSNGSATNANG